MLAAEHRDDSAGKKPNDTDQSPAMVCFTCTLAAHIVCFCCHTPFLRWSDGVIMPWRCSSICLPVSCHL